MDIYLSKYFSNSDNWKYIISCLNQSKTPKLKFDWEGVLDSSKKKKKGRISGTSHDGQQQQESSEDIEGLSGQSASQMMSQVKHTDVVELIDDQLTVYYIISVYFLFTYKNN